MYSRSRLAGYAACSRVYLWFHASAVTTAAVCGAFFSGLSCGSHSPAATLPISAEMAIIASQNRSSSARFSLSVGSTISVPATGKDIVGAWMPKSISRLATSSAVIPVFAAVGRRSRMHSWATSPPRPV